jgi:two-component system OmpR family sensor kinase
VASSIVRRVASGAALAASASALVAALATIVFATFLMQRAEDRRLEEAAVTFAAELGLDGGDIAAIREVHRDESEEMDHTGMLFAVYDARGVLLVGDRRVGLPAVAGCSTTNSRALRVCRAEATNGLAAVVGAAHTPLTALLAAAAILAALFAAALAWATSRPISRHVVAPLTRLRERIAQLDIDALEGATLGSEEGIVEVDALRRTIEQLIVRVERALSQAHRFAANAAHELRTPLTTVRAELELLAENIMEPGAREGATVAQQKLAELSMLVERLLILSVPARSAADAHEVVSLRDLLEDVVQSLPNDDRSRVKVSEGDALVRGDATLLGTMVANAIANGLKFGSAVTTEVSLVEGIAVLHVDDDGPGVEASERERAFEPFFRSSEALRRRIPGHGLGLALIRHIATTHGGGATLVDKRTQGARLEIRLPVADDGAGQGASVPGASERRSK